MTEYERMMQQLAILGRGSAGRMAESMGRRDQAGRDLRSATAQQPNRRLANPGQRGLDVLGIGPEGRANQTDNQSRALLQMGLGMMGGERGEKPGGQFSRGIQSGLGLLDTLREGDRTRDIETATADYTTADADVETNTGIFTEYADAVTAGLPTKGSAKVQNTSRYVDEDGNQFFVSLRENADGTTEQDLVPIGHENEQSGKLTALGSKGLTPQQRIDEKAQAEFQTILRADSARNAQAALDQFKQVRSSLQPVNQALEALDRGAETGPLSDLLPSFRESTVTLENAMRRMGLDVVGATTFGALSAGELELALSINRPPSMQEMPLREFLTKKRNAQVALMRELNDAARFFEGGGLPSEYMARLEASGRFEGPDPTRNKEIDALLDKYAPVGGAQ